MNAERNERRERMLEKVRKLLAMGRDGRGNENEAETAMRQANKIMAEYGIAEAECDMSAINAGEMSFGEAQCNQDGGAPGSTNHRYKSVPQWAGVLAVGVARFTDSVVRRRTTAHGEMFVFQGEQNDVLLARWIMSTLVASIQAEQKKSGWHTRSDAATFRYSASCVLARRMKDLATERKAMYEKARVESGSMALVVVDRKHTEIVARFGAQKIRSTSGRSSGADGASIAGSEAGRRINIPAGRPIASNNAKRISA